MNEEDEDAVTPEEIDEAASHLDGGEPEAILEWAVERFTPHVAFATAFGAEGCVLVDVIARNRLPIEILTLDTGLLFPETLALRQRLEQRYGLRIRVVRPQLSVEEQAVAHGDRLWERDPDRCCYLRKVAPLEAALAGFRAWITSVRRDQTPERARARVVEADPRFGLVKVNPLVGWTSARVWAYVSERGVPYNPLHDTGYPSVGCIPCTSPVSPGEAPRAGRWRGLAKTECGLHVGPARHDWTLSLSTEKGA